MRPIVCAIRGGPHSRPTIDKAISFAGETGLPLYFLFIVNLDFLAHTTSTRTHTISREMEQMGEFILLTAQSRAAEQGVAAEGVVRHGSVGPEIIAFCREIDAGTIVMGRPQLGEDEGDVFTQSRLNAFVDLVKGQTGAEVVMPDREEK